MAQDAISDEQYGALHRKLDDFLRRVKEGTTISFEDAMDLIQTAISGSGYKDSERATLAMAKFGFLTGPQCIIAQNLLSLGGSGPGSQGNFTKVQGGDLIVTSFEYCDCHTNLEGKEVISGHCYEGLPTLHDIKEYASNATMVSFYHYPSGAAAVNAPKKLYQQVGTIAEVYRDDKRPHWVFLLESGGVITLD